MDVISLLVWLIVFIIIFAAIRFAIVTMVPDTILPPAHKNLIMGILALVFVLLLLFALIGTVSLPPIRR